MGFPWTARTRRLIFVVVMLVVLTFPLVSTLITRARVERSGVDVTATVVETPRDGDRYLVSFRFPEEIDADQQNYSAEIDKCRTTRRSPASRSGSGCSRTAARPPGRGRDPQQAPYVTVAVADAIVLVVGLWWVKIGRRRPTVRCCANGPLEPADPDEVGSLARQPDDAFEAVGTVLSADDAEVVVDVGERRVVVSLVGYENPVPVGSAVRARGPMIG